MAADIFWRTWGEDNKTFEGSQVEGGVKYFELFYIKYACQYYSCQYYLRHDCALNFMGWAVKIVNAFEGGEYFYHYGTFQPIPPQP